METSTDRTVVYESAHLSTGLSASAVSWGAIVGGAVAAAAMSLILFVLGTGLGLTSVSPWMREGIAAETFGVAAILWVIFTSVASSALGGYLAGRLRTRWLEVPRDEVYFRDTAHGFLAWALGALLTAVLFASAMASVVSTGARASMSVASPAAGVAALASTAAGDGTLDYYLDTLLRRDPPAASSQDASPVLAEASRTISRAYRRGELSAEDLDYLGQLVARYTGLSQQEAEARVRTTYDNLGNELRAVADTVRATSAAISLWCFVALLAGAFAASCTALCGGRQRDL